MILNKAYRTILCLDFNRRISCRNATLYGFQNYFKYNILRKTIEGYLDSVPSLTFKTIKTLLIMHAFHSTRLLQSKLMFYFSHGLMV